MSHTENTDLKQMFQYNTRQCEPDEMFDERWLSLSFPHKIISVSKQVKNKTTTTK